MFAVEKFDRKYITKVPYVSLYMLVTIETESSLEINFLIGKIKHTVKRIKRQDSSDHTEVE